MTRPILIKIKHIYGGLQSQVCPYQTDTWPSAAVAASLPPFVLLAHWLGEKFHLQLPAALAKNVVANATCERRCERERRCASCERMRERERGRAAAACDERRCCCSATAGAVKFCKAEAPCWCSWRATVLLEFQSQRKLNAKLAKQLNSFVNFWKNPDLTLENSWVGNTGEQESGRERERANESFNNA